MIFTISDELKQEFAKIYKELYKEEEDDEKVYKNNQEIEREAWRYLYHDRIKNIREEAAEGCKPEHKDVFMDCKLDEITKDDFWLAVDMLTSSDSFDYMWREKFDFPKDKGHLERYIITKNYFKIEEKILDKKMAFYVKCFFFLKYFYGRFKDNPSIDPLGFCAKVVRDVAGCRVFFKIELFAKKFNAEVFYSHAAYLHKFDYGMIIKEKMDALKRENDLKKEEK